MYQFVTQLPVYIKCQMVHIIMVYSGYALLQINKTHFKCHIYYTKHYSIYHISYSIVSHIYTQYFNQMESIQCLFLPK